MPKLLSFLFQNGICRVHLTVRRSQMINTPFSKEQKAWMVIQLGSLKNISKFMRKFRLHFRVNPSL